jgi:RNA polymerase sigma-70 factor (TIGR02943 family)
MVLRKNQQNAAEWVNQYSDELYRYSLNRVRDSDAAKDLVQETFLAAWRNIDHYNGEASVKTWLFTILKNKIIDHYRKASTRFEHIFSKTIDKDDPFFDSFEHWAEHAYPKDWEINYENPIETDEFYTVLNKCKGKLKEIQNAVFSLKYLEGLESEEICKVLNLSSSNYWVLLHRAKTQLRACLEMNWFVRE